MWKGMRSRMLAGFLGVGALVLAFNEPVSAQDLSLNEVKVEAGDTTRVVLFLSDVASGSAVSTFTLSDPDRLVIDIADTTANMEVTRVDGDGVLVDRAEVVSFDDGTGLTTRITLYLNRNAGDIQPQVVSDGAKVTVALPVVEQQGDDPVGDALEEEGVPGYGQNGASRQLSGPDRLVGGTTLTSLDFRNVGDKNRVIVGLQGTTSYEVSRLSDNLLVIDIPGAFVPQSLQRPLDTGEFISPVRMVRAYKTGTGARIAVTLRRNTNYTHTLTGQGLLILELDVPSDMQDQRQDWIDRGGDVSPGRPDSSGANAYAQEVYIGGDGRSVSPSSTWDQYGYSDPTATFSGAAGFMFDSSSSSSLPFSGRRISLDFVNADIHSIFRLISHVSRLNIVASDDVQGQVTVRMTDVPWDMALAAVLQSKGLGSQRFGNIVRVAPIETIKTEQQAALEAKRAVIEMQDLSLLVVPLNYVQASSLEKQVEALLSSRGSIQLDLTSNQLVIQETEQRLVQIRELIRYLDRQTPQVLIEARIVEANSNFAKAMGVQWGSELDATTRTGYGTGLFFPSGVGMGGGVGRTGGSAFYTSGTDALMVDLGAEGANSGVAFSLGSIPGLVNLDARLSALETDGWGKVISQPRVTTLDNKQATISQGQKIPFMSTSAGGTNVQFIKAELELAVTPHITSDNKVFLAVTVANNRADFSQLVQGQPAIQTKEVKTELLVADGDTTVMGGVFASEHSYSQDRVPGFSKIPLVGYLFKNSAEALSRNELLVFLTPHIVTRPQRTSK